jgi:hypothetical protein
VIQDRHDAFHRRRGIDDELLWLQELDSDHRIGEGHMQAGCSPKYRDQDGMHLYDLFRVMYPLKPESVFAR